MADQLGVILPKFQVEKTSSVANLMRHQGGENVRHPRIMLGTVSRVEFEEGRFSCLMSEFGFGIDTIMFLLLEL